MSERPLAIVTGAARRVGRTSALALARSGCDVLITYRSSDDEAVETVRELERLGAAAWAAPLDVGRPEGFATFAEGLPEAFERLDVLVHNASIYSPTRLDDANESDALRHYTVNALGPLLLTRALLSRLRRSARPGGAAIVAMVDIHAMGRPRAGFAPYAMSKAALLEMIRSLAVELAPGVRVNGVAPGVVAWPEEGYESDEASQQAYLQRVPLARAGEPADAAEAVRWLAMDATYTTGQVVRVDGGRWLR